MGARPYKAVVVCLSVDQVLAVAAHEPFHALTVEWEKAALTDGGADTRPGAEGTRVFNASDVLPRLTISSQFS
jgi:hypothetical protein